LTKKTTKSEVPPDVKDIFRTEIEEHFSQFLHATYPHNVDQSFFKEQVQHLYIAYITGISWIYNEIASCTSPAGFERTMKGIHRDLQDIQKTNMEGENEEEQPTGSEDDVSSRDVPATD